MHVDLLGQEDNEAPDCIAAAPELGVSAERLRTIFRELAPSVRGPGLKQSHLAEILARLGDDEVPLTSLHFT